MGQKTAILATFDSLELGIPKIFHKIINHQKNVKHIEKSRQKSV